MMRARIKDAFDFIKADDELKDTTRDFISAYREFPSRRRRRMFRRFVPASACMLLLVLSGGYLYFTPTAAVSIDINPSVELEVNRFDRVLSVSGFNEDGVRLSEDLDVRFDDCQSAVETILNDEEIISLLSSGEYLDITVVCSNDRQSSRLLYSMEDCTRQHRNAHCSSVQNGELEAAHDHGLSYGKYRAFLALQEIYPDITADEVRNMTMKEIREILNSESADYGFQNRDVR